MKVTLENYYGNFIEAANKYISLRKEVREENYNHAFFHSRKREEIEIKISVYQSFEELMDALDVSEKVSRGYVVGYLRKIAIDKLREFENTI